MRGGAPKEALTVRYGAKRNPMQIEMDSWWIVGEVSKGRTYQSIADELNENREYKLSKEAVRNDVNRIMVEWKRQNLANIDAVIGKELARLEGIEEKVYADYEKSKNLKALDYGTMLKRGFTVEEIEAMFEGKIAGDPRYLEVLLHVQMQRMKLLGIDKGNDLPQNTIVNYNFGSMTDEQLASIADSLQDDKAAEMLKTITTDEQ